jgi:hypothetical protein
MAFDVITKSILVNTKTPQYKIGDKFKRSDHYDPKIYTIDKLALWRDEWIYSAEGQGWIDGWAWISEYNMKVA